MNLEEVITDIHILLAEIKDKTAPDYRGPVNKVTRSVEQLQKEIDDLKQHQNTMPEKIGNMLKPGLDKASNGLTGLSEKISNSVENKMKGGLDQTDKQWKEISSFLTHLFSWLVAIAALTCLVHLYAAGAFK